MARDVWQKTITSLTGDALNGAQITVRNQQTNALAAVFDAQSGGSQRPNPFLTGADGVARFFAEPGFYKVTAFKDGFGTAEFIWNNLGDNNVRQDINSVAVGLTGNQSASGLKDFTSGITSHGLTVGRGGGAIDTNTAVGRDALRDNTTGTQNTANGVSALRDNTTGTQNTANGRNALLSNTTGNRNTANGSSALVLNTTGNNNIGIGQDAGFSTSPFAVTTQSNRIVMGNNDHTDAYIRVSWTVTSDARDKTQFAPIALGLDFVESLEPTEYQFRKGGREGEGNGRRRFGFLAQQVLECEGADPVITDTEDPENLKLHESYLIPVLVNAIKELSSRVKELEK